MLQKQFRHEVLIVGAGVSGICLGARLKLAGIDFVVLERATNLGGTWRDNTYPGCQVDVPSHKYSFAFALNADWSHRCADQPEILAYLVATAKSTGVAPHIQYEAEVQSADYDDASSTWLVSTEEGDQYRAAVVVLATGPLHEPSVPDIPGLSSFIGQTFHSARWNHGFSLAGKQVAVIGTGASAVQLIPHVQRWISHLYVFQRTPPWILPRQDQAIAPLIRNSFRVIPGLMRTYRTLLYLQAEITTLGFSTFPRLLRIAELAAKRFLHAEVADPHLREQLTPDYALGCKRILRSDDFYSAACKNNVEIITGPISRVQGRFVYLSDETRRQVDAIIFATGFRVSEAFRTFPVRGVNGRSLRDEWRCGASAYLGMSVSGFPNLFLMVGPNTGLGHNSLIFMIEAQARYISRALARRLGFGAEPMTVRREIQLQFNTKLQRRLRRAVWSVGGCSSWYIDDDTGTNRALWPGSTITYWLHTRRVRWRDYELVPTETSRRTDGR